MPISSVATVRRRSWVVNGAIGASLRRDMSVVAFLVFRARRRQRPDPSRGINFLNGDARDFADASASAQLQTQNLRIVRLQLGAIGKPLPKYLGFVGRENALARSEGVIFIEAGGRVRLNVIAPYAEAEQRTDCLPLTIGFSIATAI